MQFFAPETHQMIRRVLVALFTIYFTYIFVKNGWRKFDPEGFWAAPFERWGYPVWFLYFVGVVEFGGGIALLIPRISGYVAVLLAGVMLGALVTRLINGVSVADAMSISFYLVGLLLLAYERKPFRSMLKSPSQPSTDSSPGTVAPPPPSP